MTYVNRADLIENRIEEFVETYNKDKEQLKTTVEKALTKRDIKCKEIDNRFGNIEHVINTQCVLRYNTDYKDIKSVIYLGDITTLSEKKFSKFTKWLYNKLFGWTIVDYHWGDIVQTKIFN